MPGPAPNPNSRRQQSGRNITSWTDLPSDGYGGPVPAWPFAKKNPAEAAMWTRYWHKPQAAAWAHLGLTDEVAMYVRAFLLGSGGDLKALTEARQWGDRLGLNPTAMLKNRWRIRDTEVGAPAQDAPVAAPVKKARTLKVAE